MIRIHRNHPSIIVWSMGNEDFFNGGPADRVDRAAQEGGRPDPPARSRADWRPAAIGGAQSAIGSTQPDTLGDVAGFNGDGVGYRQPRHAQHGVGIRQRVLDSARELRSRLGELDGHERHARPNPRGAAECPIGACSITAPKPTASYGIMGIVDYFRIPKRSYYWYRNAYAKVAPPTWPASGTPAGLKLTSSTTTLSAVDGTQDAWLLVTVVDASGKPINNNVPVTLTVTSGPGEFPTGPSITFTAGDGQAGERYRHSRRPSRHRI